MQILCRCAPGLTMEDAGDILVCMKNTVLFVHPSKEETQRGMAALQQDFEVLPVRQPEIAMATIKTLRPWAVVVAATQNRMSGLELVADLQQRLGGGFCRMVVYGAPAEVEDSGNAEQLQERLGLDQLCLSDCGGFDQMVIHLRDTAKTRARQSAPRQAKEPDPMVISWGQMLAVEAPEEDVAALIRDEIFGSRESIAVALEDTPAQSGTGKTAGYRLMTWPDLLQSPASKSSIKAMLTRPIWTK